MTWPDKVSQCWYTLHSLKCSDHFNKPGHGASSHSSVFPVTPEHCAPPFSGAGFEHVLPKFCSPVPHVTLQPEPVGVHDDHSPSTVIEIH